MLKPDFISVFTQQIFKETVEQQVIPVGNELVHAGSHARPQAVYRGMPSQGGSTE